MGEFIYLNEIIRFSMGILLVVAAYSKTIGYRQFIDTLASSFHLNRVLSLVVAPTVIAVEWGVGLILVVYPPMGYWAIGAALVMFLLFTLAVSFMLYRDGFVKCNCFGAEDRPVSLADIVRNIICILAMLFYLQTTHSVSALAIESSILIFVTAISIAFILVNFHRVVSILNKAD